MPRHPFSASIAAVLLACALALAAPAPPSTAAPDSPHGSAPTIVVDLPASTQGPLWPPAVVTNADGDFPLVGIALVPVDGVPGFPIFDQAVLVSKNTVPPLDENGHKINNNWFLAPYDIVRPLDLSPGSPDLDMVLYNLSIGPPDDDTEVPRIPRVGDSAYNLYTDPRPCPEIFPSPSQATTYTRPRFPLHQVPILGFQGDQVAYDIVTGDPYVPVARGGLGCPFGCPGEDVVDQRRTEPITLGQWLRASGKLKITLTDLDPARGAYTAADFEFKLSGMIPKSVYTVFAVRPRRIPGFGFTPQADPLATPSLITTDRHGKGSATFHVEDPFPDPDTDFELRRITGVVVTWHPDYQNWGACGGIFGAGVDVQTQLNSLIKGNIDFTPFITVPP